MVVKTDDLEIFVVRETRGGLVRVTRIAPVEGVLETWLARAEDVDGLVFARWSDVHVEALGYRPWWQQEPPARPRRIPLEVVAADV